MMDEDFGFDGTVGKKEIDIDGLLVNDKMTANIAFNEVKQCGYLDEYYDHT